MTVTVKPCTRTVTGSYPSCPDPVCQLFPTLSFGFLRHCFKKRHENISLYSSLLFIIILTHEFYVRVSVHRSINVIDDQKDATIFGLFIYSQSALHVLGDVFAHHQEHLTVFYSFWYNPTILLPTGIMDEMKRISI